MSQVVYVGDYGFNLGFVAKLSLGGMSEVRMLIVRPMGPPVNYDFTPGQYTPVGVDDTLDYLVRSTDLTMPGEYSFQVVAKAGALDFAFEPLILTVKQRVVADSWA